MRISDIQELIFIKIYTYHTKKKKSEKKEVNLIGIILSVLTATRK